jgi:hypothetical protein
MKRPSASLAISLVALFFSLAGASFAASPYIITSTTQIKPNVLRALHGKRGLPGTQGPQGPAGQDGTPGVFTANDLAVVDGPITTLCADGGPASCVVGSSIAQCPAGTTVVSGGYTGSLISGTVGDNQPLGPTAWEVIAINLDTTSTQTVQAVAVCAS